LLRSIALGRGTVKVGLGDAVGVGIGSGWVQAANTSRESPEPAPKRKLRRLNDISATLYSETLPDALSERASSAGGDGHDPRTANIAPA
jgi:hypothetical protein